MEMESQRLLHRLANTAALWGFKGQGRRQWRYFGLGSEPEDWWDEAPTGTMTENGGLMRLSAMSG